MSCEYQALRVAFTYSRNLRSSILLFPQSFTSALSLFSVEPGYVGYEHQISKHVLVAVRVTYDRMCLVHVSLWSRASNAGTH